MTTTDGYDSQTEGQKSTPAMPRGFDCAATAGVTSRGVIAEMLTPQELAEVDDAILKRVAEIWRAQALRGDTRASSIAIALENELRRRSSMDFASR